MPNIEINPLKGLSESDLFALMAEFERFALRSDSALYFAVGAVRRVPGLMEQLHAHVLISRYYECGETNNAFIAFAFGRFYASLMEEAS